MVKTKFFSKIENFLIAEAGINHNGKVKTALKLVDVAKKNAPVQLNFRHILLKKELKKNTKKYLIF